MIISNKQVVQVLESTERAINLLHREVGSMDLRMKQLEKWQNTMDMTLKRMLEDS